MIALSIIIPVYKSEATIEALVHKLQLELSAIHHEIVLVVDGSPDHSEDICFKLAAQKPNILAIALRRNYGEFNAVLCGMQHSRGDYVVMVDDDMQQAPSEILKLWHCINHGNYDVVYGKYLDKKHAWYRNIGTWAVHKISEKLFEKPQEIYLSSFKMIKQEVVREIVKYRGHNPFIDGIIFRITKNIGQVVVSHQERAQGSSNYTFDKLFNLMLSVVFGYSMWPVRMILKLGLGMLLLSVLLFVLNLGGLPIHFAGLLVLYFTGLLLFLGGILGEYVAKNYLIQANLPQYCIKRSSK